MDDFVRLRPKQLCEEVFFGTYQLRLSQSYVGDLVDRGSSYTFSDTYIKSLNDSRLKNDLQSGRTKIIGVTIPSRHQRGLKDSTKKNSDFRTVYKVLLKYDPQEKTAKSIQSKSLISLARFNLIYNSICIFRLRV